MNTPRHWAVVPAAGVGRRVGSQIPKQYLPLAGRVVLEHTLERLLNHPCIHMVAVAIGATDVWWPQIALASDPRILRVPGGAERYHSVLNALIALEGLADEHDWVLVHDAVRPCLRKEDLDRLLQIVDTSTVGGLLGGPVRDTIKRVDASKYVETTVLRDKLWHAYTPQMFRLGLLRKALDLAIRQGLSVTDEAQAMELANYHPILVEGHTDNLKITHPEDLALAEFFISRNAAAVRVKNG